MLSNRKFDCSSTSKEVEQDEIKKYFISMLNPADNIYTLHRHIPDSKVIQGMGFTIRDIKYHKYGKFYKGDKALISRLKMGITANESYEIDHNLPEKQKRHIDEMIENLLKKEEEQKQWP